ncbi:MAG TPA: MFS transporter [Candidatus Cloacimonadota bacterium]|nr:MFS transporter [Candidatus Cloacimonadota bacterium]
MNRKQRKISHKSENSTIQKTFRISILEGAFAHIYSILSANGTIFVTKFLWLLGASPLHFSILAAIGQFSAIFQPVGVAITHKLTQRKQTCITTAGIGRGLTLLIGISLLFTNHAHGIWFILILFLISQGFQSISGNVWIAWISDIIPNRFRGRFFSKRNQIFLIIGLIVGYLVSFHVDLFEHGSKGLQHSYLQFLHWQKFFQPGNQAYFLSGLFVVASLIGLVGLFILNKQPEKSKIVTAGEKLRTVYAAPFKDKNFLLLLLFGIWWMLAVGIGSAFWGPFMIDKLKMSMFEIQIYGSINTIVSLFSYNFWGKFIDRFGNKVTMIFCIFLGGLNPTFWLFMQAEQHTLIWFEAVSSGVMWSATGIVMTNFVLSIAPKKQAQVYSGVFGAITGISMMFSTLLTGFFFPKSHLLLGYEVEPEQIIFAIGAAARWTAIIPLLFVQERAVKPFHAIWLSIYDYAKLKISQTRDFKS